MDLFIICEGLSGKKYEFKGGVPHRVIADHLRMLSFSIADGVIPSNDGRGYVLRRVLRRAVRYGDLIGIKEPFLNLLVDDLIPLMGDTYPEIQDKKEHIKNTLKREEELFRNTLEKGITCAQLEPHTHTYTRTHARHTHHTRYTRTRTHTLYSHKDISRLGMSTPTHS